MLPALAVAGCAALPGGGDPRAGAEAIARAHGMQETRAPAGRFLLTTFHRGLATQAPLLVVYVEGDGRAWATPRRPSRDPSPREPTGLRLAVQDPGAAVLYVARPCQYLDPGGAAACGVRYWTDARFAPEVLDAVDTVIGRAQAAAPGRRVGLVGYSGGGVVAALLAARRRDVAWLVTVAAPLDLERWTALHGLSPLHAPLPPAALAGRLAGIPQRHLAGGRDEVVPVAVLRGFLALLPAPRDARIEVQPGFDHRCCWARAWPRLRPWAGPAAEP